MKFEPVRTFLTMFIALSSFLITSAADSATRSPAQTTIQDLQEKVEEAVQTIKSNSVVQRDQAVAKARAILEDFDARINALESRLNQEWAQMDKTAQQESASAMAVLRKQRDTAAEWYGGLKHGSSQAWEDVRAGFSKSVQDLDDAIREAYKKV